MAEKFFKFRDPGTGIQVFLTPTTSAAGSSSSFSLSSALLPLFVVLGVIRSIIGGLCWGLYLATGWNGFLRVVLFTLGFLRLKLDHVSSNTRRKGALPPTPTSGKGGLVVANHSSWIDLLIISYLYPGTQFVVPVIKEQLSTANTSQEAGLKKRGTPKQNAMSANTRIVTPSSPSTTSSAPDVIEGYTLLSLTSALPFVGGLPPTSKQVSAKIHPTLSAALTSTPAPKTFFPEVVTSNNRALLHFTTPPLPPHTHVLTLKYAPPTPTSITSVYTVGQPVGGLPKHLLQILFASGPVRGVTLKHSVKVDEDDSDVSGLMSSMARLKRTSIDWWLKREFLTMVRGRSKRS